MVDRYIDPPDMASFGGKYSLLNSFYYAFYYLAPNAKFKQNDYQPEELVDELMEDIHNIYHIYPTVILLMSSKEKLKCQKIPFVWQFMSQINKLNLRSMPITCFLCITHLETRMIW